MLTHVNVRAKAPRSQHDPILGMEGHGLALMVCLDADNTLAVILDEFSSLSIHQNFNTQFFCLGVELGHQFLAGVAFWNQGPLVRMAAKLEELVFQEFDANHVT